MSAVLVGLCGPMGSGKSYEAMAEHVLPALKKGQKVATNIKGIKEEKKLKWTAELTGRSVEELKELIVEVPETKEELFKPGVFPDALDWEKESVIPKGSLVVLDECATVFDTKPPEHVMRYITQQRHGVDEKGNTGRMVIISQSPQIHHSVRKLMSAVYLFSKFSMLAPLMKVLRPLKLGADYRAEVYTDMSKTIGRSKPDNMLSRRYDPKVFGSYMSVDADTFKAMGLDKRTTILGNKFVMVWIPVFMVLMVWAGMGLFEKFGGALKDKPVVAEKKEEKPKEHLGQEKKIEVSEEFSKEFKLVGYFISKGDAVYLLEDPEGRMRYVSTYEIASVENRGPQTVIRLRDGKKVSHFTGKNGGNDVKKEETGLGASNMPAK